MYTFVIPLMFFSCLHWDVTSGDHETIANFDFQQSVEIDVSNLTALELRGNHHMVRDCAAVQARQGSLVTIIGGSFDIWPYYVLGSPNAGLLEQLK